MAHAHAMSLPYRYGHRYAAYLSSRPNHYTLRPQTLSATLLAGGLEPVPQSLGKTSGLAIPKTTANAKPISPGAANCTNLHKPRTAQRGFVPRGLSDAKRRPKLFTRDFRTPSGVRNSSRERTDGFGRFEPRSGRSRRRGQIAVFDSKRTAYRRHSNGRDTQRPTIADGTVAGI